MAHMKEKNINSKPEHRWRAKCEKKKRFLSENLRNERERNMSSLPRLLANTVLRTF
jgi:hypothetical protein